MGLCFFFCFFFFFAIKCRLKQQGFFFTYVNELISLSSFYQRKQICCRLFTDKKNNWHYMQISRIDKKLSFKLAKKQISLHSSPTPNTHIHAHMHTRTLPCLVCQFYCRRFTDKRKKWHYMPISRTDKGNKFNSKSVSPLKSGSNISRNTRSPLGPYLFDAAKCCYQWWIINNFGIPGFSGLLVSLANNLIRAFTCSGRQSMYFKNSIGSRIDFCPRMMKLNFI